MMTVQQQRVKPLVNALYPPCRAALYAVSFGVKTIPPRATKPVQSIGVGAESTLRGDILPESYA